MVKRLDKSKEARRAARKALKPGATKVVPNKKRKPPKHKRDWNDWEFEIELKSRDFLPPNTQMMDYYEKA